MYGVSKLAINSYCKAKAKELEGKKIMLNSCCPGALVSRSKKCVQEGGGVLVLILTSIMVCLKQLVCGCGCTCVCVGLCVFVYVCVRVCVCLYMHACF